MSISDAYEMPVDMVTAFVRQKDREARAMRKARKGQSG